MRFRVLVFCVVLVLMSVSTPAWAEPAPSYYVPAQGLDGEALAKALHEVIKDHKRFPYSSNQMDTWDLLEIVDQDPQKADHILALYRNRSQPKRNRSGTPGVSDGWNREHTWPKSYGFHLEDDCNFPYTDLHHLFASNTDYNSERGNKPFDWVDKPEEVLPVDGGSGQNESYGEHQRGGFEVWPGRRGDVARAMFYMDVRYDGGQHGNSQCAEPNLILTDKRELLQPKIGFNADRGFMGFLSVLLEWHLEDGVTQADQRRNDQVESYQKNRNPFVDRPDWVCHIWDCKGLKGYDTVAPAVPAKVAASKVGNGVGLDWKQNTEKDLAGYLVYRSKDGQASELVTGAVVLENFWRDTRVPSSGSYSYQVVAVDLSGNSSQRSPAVSIQANSSGSASAGKTASPGKPAQSRGRDGSLEAVVVNEFLPRPGTAWNPAAGTDTSEEKNEWIELYNTGSKPVDLSGAQLDDAEGGSKPWTIPRGTVIPGRGFVVFFSQQTGIALNNKGDEVRFLRPDGMVLDSISFQVVERDESQGRYADGTDAWLVFSGRAPGGKAGQPSPGKPNVP